MQEETKRVFFALEVSAPWSHELPKGRILEEKDRHLTLAFLGQVPVSQINEALSSLSLPPFRVGLVGRFDHPVFLPERHPHVVAWHVDWFGSSQVLEEYQKQLVQALKDQGFKINESDRFLPHVTLCREPFHQKEWRESFTSLPMMTTSLHLYESLGHCRYEPIWTHAILPPFQEIEHTADLAFYIYGESLTQLYRHALTALAFKFPPLINLFDRIEIEGGIEEVIIHLNEVVSKADQTIGCPFKAVSFHGEVSQENHLLKWEMIIDV